jgi:hypothetical protein
MGPFGVVVYELDTSNASLQKLWSLPEDDYFGGIKLYPAARILVIAAEPWGYKPFDRLYIVPFDSASSLPAPVVDYRGTASSMTDCRLVDNGDGRFFLSVSVESSPDSAGAFRSEEIIVDLSTRRTTSLSALSSAATTRLAGPGTFLRASRGEIERVDLSLRGDHWIPVNTELESGMPPIPDSVVHMKTSFCWNLIANEPAYYILNSVAERGGLTSSELLICRRSQGKWSSIQIPGTDTRLRLFGAWFGGVVTDPDPSTDYERRIGGAPLPREEVVLVNPLELRAFTVHLGKWCELLSIEGDVVFYRIEKELYRARIQDDDFVDRQLILKDLQVVGIGWAFSDSE